MNTRDKLAMKAKIEARNDARIKEFLDVTGAHKALEVQTRATVGSLEILSNHYHIPRNSLLEQLIIMLQVELER